MENKKISILGVCSGLGQKLDGLDLAPDLLRKNGLVELISNKIKQVTDLGNITPSAEDKIGWDLIKQLRDKAFLEIKNGNSLLTIGGDHSIAIGTVQASLAVFPNTKVIWVDAHSDINTPETTLSGNLHGMPLAALLGLFQNTIEGPTLLPENLLLVGLRDTDPAERIFLKKLNIQIITSEEINREPDFALQKMNAWIRSSSDSPIHLSFDIDAINPEFAPATGLRVPGGLSLDFSKSISSMIADTKRLISFDFVELNPLMAKSKSELEQTVYCAKEIIMCALKN